MRGRFAAVGPKLRRRTSIQIGDGQKDKWTEREGGGVEEEVSEGESLPPAVLGSSHLKGGWRIHKEQKGYFFQGALILFLLNFLIHRRILSRGFSLRSRMMSVYSSRSKTAKYFSA